MKNKKFLTTTELAKLLGISRIAVFKKIKKGEIKAEKIGRNFVIHKKDLGIILGKVLSKKDKLEIEKAVKKVIKEYGETLRLLGNS
ncbi:helix-turn-helix domain-containing protein [Patescibacteria group bacterium]|nr:helix-turn-helix domain-containing protein [Patescibacteria group bacterium]